MPAVSFQNQLDDLLPYGLIATRRWLLAQGLAPHRLDNALKSGKVHALAVGAYARQASMPGWQAVLCSLQRMSDQPVLLGGVSALVVLGHGQYLPMGEQHIVTLYADDRPPAWVVKVQDKVAFRWHGVQALWPRAVADDDYFRQSYRWRDDMPELLLSCAERAYLEMLAGIPNRISFDHADELLQGLTSLSPRKLDALLLACKSIKVKRLFFWLADRHNYAWNRKLSRKDYTLGTGKREIAKHGKLDATYHITVPEHLHGSQ